jgi:hypothetical protein
VATGQAAQAEHVALQELPGAQPAKPSHVSEPSTVPLPHVTHAEHAPLQIVDPEQPFGPSQTSDPATMPSPHRGRQLEQ